jgi:hypothetical protein
VERFTVINFVTDKAKLINSSKTSTDFIAQIELAIDELIHNYELGKFTREEVVYIIRELPRHLEKRDFELFHGLESLADSVSTGSITIAFDGGNALAVRAKARLEELKAKQGKAK